MRSEPRSARTPVWPLSLSLDVYKRQEEVRRIFKPEFLNRIDETIVFRALNTDDMQHIVTLLVKELKKRCKEQLDTELTVRDSAKSLSLLHILPTGI